MSDDRCPKCGKAAMVDLLYKRGHPSAPILTRRKRWVCESFSEVDREFAQSPVCRITELEQEVKRLRKKLTEARKLIGDFAELSIFVHDGRFRMAAAMRCEKASAYCLHYSEADAEVERLK